jgi:hypothetical protein
MVATTERMNLRGMTAMTNVMAAIANKPLHVGGAYSFPAGVR